MIGYIGRRAGQGLVVIALVGVLAFGMFRYLGDPVVSILGVGSTSDQRAELRRQMGLDQPLPLQFVSFVSQTIRGDLGISYRLGQPVTRVLLDRAPATIELALTGMLLAVLIGIPAGVFTAVRRGSASQAALGLSLLGISVPSFFLGMVLIFVFSVKLRWLPSYGRGETVRLGWWTTGLLSASGIRALIMPALTISAFQVAMIMRLVRAEMQEVLGADFIRFARARGLSRGAIVLRHALGNTLVPVVTIVGLQLGSVIGFAVVTESVFQWPGLGLLFLQSVGAADIPVLTAYLILIAIVFVSINLMVDLIYAAIDPRIGMAGGTP